MPTKHVGKDRITTSDHLICSRVGFGNLRDMEKQGKVERCWRVPKLPWSNLKCFVSRVIGSIATYLEQFPLRTYALDMDL